MIVTRRKIWLGIGAAALVGGSGAQADTAENTRGAATILAAVGGVSAAAGHFAPELLLAQSATVLPAETPLLAFLVEDARFAVYLGLLEGHLRAGRALAARGDFTAADAHLLRPEADRMALIDAMLDERAILGIREGLAEVARRAQARADNLLPYIDSTIARINGLRAEIAAAMADPVRFRLDVAITVLKVAAEEYRLAIVDGRVADLARYQDAHGLIVAAATEIQRLEPALVLRDLGRTADLVRDTAAVAAFAAAIDPPADLRPGSHLLATVSWVELDASGFGSSTLNPLGGGGEGGGPGGGEGG